MIHTHQAVLDIIQQEILDPCHAYLYFVFGTQIINTEKKLWAFKIFRQKQNPLDISVCVVSINTNGIFDLKRVS